MRIILRYILPWGNLSTKAIDLDSLDTIETLKNKIWKKFGIPINKQIIKYKRDGFSVILIF